MFGTRLCHILLFHFDVKMAFLHYLTFQRTLSRDQVICFDVRLAQAPGTCLLVGPLKTSSLDSVIALI